MKAFYTASSITTTEPPPEYEFLKIQTTTTAPLNSDQQQQTTTQSPSKLNSLLSECEDDDTSISQEDKNDRPTGEEAAEEDKRILHYVSALKDTDTQTSNFSTAENHRVVQQQKLPTSEDEIVETEEVFPMRMIKSFKVADFSEMNNNQIEQSNDAPTLRTGISRTTPLKLPVFTRYSLEARPFSAFNPTSQGDNYDSQRSSFEEPILNEILNEIEPQIIEVLPGNFRPLEIHFKSSSRRIKLVQKPPEKDSQQGEPEVTRSEEEPQRLVSEMWLLSCFKLLSNLYSRSTPSLNQSFRYRRLSKSLDNGHTLKHLFFITGRENFYNSKENSRTGTETDNCSCNRLPLIFNLFFSPIGNSSSSGEFYFPFQLCTN